GERRQFSLVRRPMAFSFLFSRPVVDANETRRVRKNGYQNVSKRIKKYHLVSFSIMRRAASNVERGTFRTLHSALRLGPAPASGVIRGPFGPHSAPIQPRSRSRNCRSWVQIRSSLALDCCHFELRITSSPYALASSRARRTPRQATQ